MIGQTGKYDQNVDFALEFLFSFSGRIFSEVWTRIELRFFIRNTFFPRLDRGRLQAQHATECLSVLQRRARLRARSESKV